MATIKEIEDAFTVGALADPACGGNIIVQTRSGKQYYLHSDQIDGIRDMGFCYGAIVNPSRRAKKIHYWFDIKNLTIVKTQHEEWGG